MSRAAEEPVEVLAGEHGDLRWRVLAYWEDTDLFTDIELFGGGVRVRRAGFGGPPLYPGDLLNEWRGVSDGLPWCVLARTDPVVDRLVAVTDRGAEIVLALSDVVPQFRLRFAAAVLPEGGRPGRLRAERGGRRIEDRATPVPPTPPSGSGWRPLP